MTNFLITGYYGFLNSGDDAILTSMCEGIIRLGIPTKTTILSNNPMATEEEYGVHATYRFNLLAVIKEIKNTDILLMGGGSLLQDRTSTRSLMYYLSILWLAKLFKKKCMIYANGIGPIRRKMNRFFTKLMVNRVDIITLREHLSVKELEKMGITKPLIKVTADPVFSLDLKAVSVKEILEQENVDASKPLVGVLFRDWKDKENYVIKMAKICDYVVEELKMTILFIPMKYPTDIAISNKIAEKMHCESYTLRKNYDVNTIIGIIGETKFVLSMRLHALLYAALKSVPMIGFIYDPKVKYFLKELKMYTIEDIEDFTFESVKYHIDEIMNHYQEIQENILKEVTILTAKASENETYLKQLVQQ
jgi:polysaccharide pyruvyl transferase CsaB